MRQTILKSALLAAVVGLAGVSSAQAFALFEDVVFGAPETSDPAAVANQFCLDNGFKRQIDFTFLSFIPGKHGTAASFDYIKCSMTVVDVFGAGDMTSKDSRPTLTVGPPKGCCP